MGSWEDDARCQFSVKFAEDTLVVLKKMLEPENFFESGCRVLRHPGACVICVTNNDCDKIPLHPQCRCKPDHYILALGSG